MEDKTRYICIRCGRCCTGSWVDDIEATVEDFDRWEREGRGDIIEHFPFGPGFPPVAPSGKLLERCPFLRKVKRGLYECTIHSTRPEVCREYFCERYPAGPE